MILAGVQLHLARHSYFMGESVAGALFLLSGTLFPIEVLPGWAQCLSKTLPFTYWLEGLRRALLGKGLSPSLSGLSDQAILVAFWPPPWFWCFHRWRYLGSPRKMPAVGASSI